MKVELSSSAVRVGNQLFLVDPIPLTPESRRELTAKTTVAGIFLTNANHARAAASFAAETGAPIRAAAATAEELAELEIEPIGPMPRIRAISLEGAVAGEIALYLEEDGGSLICGDALIHFGADGFAILPAKYCTDQKQLRRSLRQLLDLRFERLLFAHGEPIVHAARARLEELLA